MKKGKYLLCGICMLALFVVFAYSSGPKEGSGQNSPLPPGPRADLITIDAMAAFGRLEKPPVQFLHDAHTKALAEKNRDCSACHPAENDRLATKFKRARDTDRIAVMNIYHQECISCHGELKVAGEAAGPVDCEGCHKQQARFSSARQPMGFDQSLHLRHAASQDRKCDRCHHEYDEKTQKLFYAQGREGSCRYCHKNQDKENLRSMRSASHVACVDCHLKYKAQELSAGPVECSGCHDSAAQMKIEKMASVPRMAGKQPDFVLLKSARADPLSEGARMNFVPFDHQAHESYNSTCRACHHESLKACNECHSLGGTKQGNWVTLEKAMHAVDTQRSCRGCHLKRQDEKNCAGCHAFRGTRLENSEAACSPCHMKPVLEKETSSEPERETALAAHMLQTRTPGDGRPNPADVPERVALSKLSNLYEAVDFPHRRIVHALAGKMEGNKLAAFFHTRQGTLCQGCHHNSPASQKPPRCGNCHGRPFDAEHPLKPGLMGAYHLQCMGCHKEMGLQKPAECTDCHKKKST